MSVAFAIVQRSFHFKGCVRLSRRWYKVSFGDEIKRLTKLEKFGNFIGFTGLKRSSLNAKGTKTRVFHIFLSKSFFSHFPISGHGVIRNGSPQYESKKLEKFGNENG